MKRSRLYLIVFLILVVLAIFWFIFIRQQPQETEKQPQDLPINQTFGPIPPPKLQESRSTENPVRQTANFPDLILPTSAIVYQETSSPLTTEQGLELANFYGHSDPTVQENLVTAENLGNFIMVTLSDSFVVVKQPLSPSSIPQETEDIRGLVLDFLKPLQQTSQVWDNSVIKTDFLDSETAHETRLANRQTASLISNHVFPTLNGYRIVSKDRLPLGERGLAKVEFNLAHQDISISSTNINLDFNKQGVYPLKTLDQIISDIESKNTIVATIIPVGQTHYNYEYGDPLTAVRAEFSHIELVYFYDHQPNSFLQPVFIISGAATLTNGQTATIRSAVSAIDTTIQPQ
jgi:hypothetical protein